MALTHPDPNVQAVYANLQSCIAQAQAERDAQESRGDAYLAEIKKLEAELTQCAVDYREECDKRDAAEADLVDSQELLSVEIQARDKAEAERDEWREAARAEAAHADQISAALDTAEASLAKAEAERDEWKREAIHHSELGLAADAANQALRNDLAKAVEGLRKIAAWIERERDEKDLRLRDIHDLAHSILAEIEGEGRLASSTRSKGSSMTDERCPHGCHDGVIVQTTVYDEDLGEHRDTMIKTWCPLHGPVAEVTQAELREQDWGANDDLRQRLVADGGEGERLPAPFAEVIKQRDDTASELTRLRERVEAVQDGLRRLAQGGGSEVAKRMGIEMAADHLDAALNSDTQEENDG